MAAFMGLLGISLFIIFTIISLVNIFRKKINKSTVVIAVMGLLTFIIALIIDGSTEVKSTNGSNLQPVSSNKNTINSNAGIQIDTSGVVIDKALELVEVKLEDKSGLKNLAIIVKNVSAEKQSIVAKVKVYDQAGAVVDSRQDSENDIAQGEMWKSKIFINPKEISKVKVTDITILNKNQNVNSQNNTDNFEETVIKCAQRLIENNLKSPATAQWGESTIIDQDHYGRYMVDVMLDAENSFGALIRSEYIVVLQSVDKDGNYTYNTSFGLAECGKYDKNTYVGYLKTTNDWDKPPQKNIEKQKNEDTSSKYKSYTNPRYGFSVNYPESYIIDQEPDNGDGIVYTSKDKLIEITASGINNTLEQTLNESYEERINAIQGEIKLKMKKNNYFVISYIEGGYIYYLKSYVGTESINSLYIKYPVELKEYCDTIVTYISTNFKPGNLNESH